MKRNLLILISFCLAGILRCAAQNNIEIPLTQKDGYGCFNPAFGGITFYSEDEDSPWKKTYLKLTGIPENWTEIKHGHIETNIYQTAYQSYFLGNITPEWYEEIQKSWNWKPDTLKLSKKSVKNRIPVVYGKDATGQLKMIVDKNNNLDFSDDDSFIPFEKTSGRNINTDSIELSKAITVSFEKYEDNRITVATTPLFMAYIKQINMCMFNFPQYYIADFGGEKIAVSASFTDMQYKNPSIVLLNDSLKEGDKISNENLVATNEYIEIKGIIYKNIGVDLNKKALILQKMDSPRNELYSTQIGFKPFNFEGKDFMKASEIKLNDLRGKYVLLDFWAVWCGPCRQEIPNLKELYKKTDRSKFEIIGIVGESDSDALKKLIKDHSIAWPQIPSTDVNNINDTYGIRGYPTTFLLNPDGVIISKNLSGKELEEKVLGLLKK